MRIVSYICGLSTILYFSVFLFSCRDESTDNIGDVALTFSVDTLLFDTVFTTVGSATRSFTVRNNHNKRIKISTIKIGSGASSPFKVNVNGIPGFIHHDVEIAPKDSIFIFAQVTLNPSGDNLPLIVMDSLVFITNNKVQDLKMAAWGQDAIFLTANYPIDEPRFHLLTQNTTWTSDKPVVVYSTVVATSGVTLQVEPNTKVHLHNRTSIYFLDNSTLKVNGTLGHQVIFQGDRLEKEYQNRGGQWGRIFFSPQSYGHEINHAIIKNGTVGLHIGTNGENSGSSFNLRNTIIKNMSSVGIMVIESNLLCNNTIIGNCGDYSAYIGPGANATFLHCTFANYFSSPNSIQRRTPSVIFTNHFKYQQVVGGPEIVYHNQIGNVLFGNSIIYGNYEEEVGFDLKPGSSYTNFLFDHCIIRTKGSTSGPNFIGVLRNADPKFHKTIIQDFRLGKGSPAVGAGKPEFALLVPLDLEGTNRTSSFDLGAINYYTIPEGD